MKCVLAILLLCGVALAAIWLKHRVRNGIEAAADLAVKVSDPINLVRALQQRRSRLAA